MINSHKNISSQEIYESLLNTDTFVSSNPLYIIEQINSVQKQNQIDNDLSLDFTDLFGSMNLSEEIDIGSDGEDTKDNELFTNLDLYTSKMEKTKSIDELLDNLLNEDEINTVAFMGNDELKKSKLLDLLDAENTPSKTELEHFNGLMTDDEIYEKIFNVKKKIGSSLQQTINVYKLLEMENLYYAEDSLELSELIINKLCTYNKIIVDFDKINTVTDVFLKEAFKNVGKFLSYNEFNEKVDIINISDRTYINFIKVIYPTIVKFWETTSDKLYLNNKDKESLIRFLDHDSKEYFEAKDRVIKNVPFERFDIPIGKRRENKLRYPIWFVERVTEEVLSLYSINDKIHNFLSENLPIDFEDLWYNCKIKNSSDYRYLIPEGLFDDLNNFCEGIILDGCNHYLNKYKKEIEDISLELDNLKNEVPKKFLSMGGVCFQNLFLDDKLMKSIPITIRYKLRRIEELEFMLLDLEHKFIIKQDILLNVFETIPFTNYKQELDKIQLISYHYLCKYLESISEQFKEIGGPKKLNGYLNILEMFRYDLLGVLCSNSILRKFIFSMKDLISKWVTKYTFGSRIAKFYFDIMMITPDILTEQILRAISLNVIRNKNPMTLRSIYSSYVSMVHIIIDSDINSFDFSKRRVGSFISLNNNMPDERAIVNNTIFKISFEEECLLKIWLYKNPKELNANHFLMQRINFSKFLEIDSLRIYSTKPKEIGLFDWYFYYMKYIRFIEKDEDIVYKIKSKFLKSDKRNSQLKIIEIMTRELLFDKIYDSVMDGECASEILGVIAEDISMRTINKGYMDTNFNLIVKSNQEYLNYIHETLIEIKNRI